jgi:hypothetical protein
MTPDRHQIEQIVAEALENAGADWKLAKLWLLRELRGKETR